MNRNTPQKVTQKQECIVTPTHCKQTHAHTVILFTLLLISRWIIPTSTRIKEEPFRSYLKHFISLDYFNDVPWGLLFFAPRVTLHCWLPSENPHPPVWPRYHPPSFVSPSVALQRHSHTRTGWSVFFRGSQLRIQRPQLRFSACGLVGDILIMCGWQKQPANTQLMCYPAVLHVTHLM